MDKLIPEYPKQNDPEIQPKVAAKEELQEYAGRQDERLSEDKPFFNQQILIMYLMRFLDVLLLYHRAGTGKTITFARSTEDYIDRMNNDGTIGRIIYLSPSGNLEQETKYQLVFRYPNSRYLTPEIRDAKSIKSRKNNITRALGKYYQFSTYERFWKANYKKSESALINEFGRTYFVLDEYQLVNDKSTQGKEINNWLKYLLRLLHGRIKLLICTATPIIDNVRELVKFANILNLEDVKGTLTPDDPDMEPKIKAWFAGRVSYVRELDTGIQLKYRGEPLFKGSYQTVVAEEMGILQSIVYTKAYLEQGSANVWQIPREASDCIFPDGSTGKQGAEKYFTSIDDDSFESPLLMEYLGTGKCKKCKNVNYLKVPKGDKFPPEEWDDMGDYYQRVLCPCKQRVLEKIGVLSVKAKSYIESLFRIWKNSYPRKGVSYCNCETVEVGVAPMSIFLEAMGFERYRYAKGHVTVDKLNLEPKLRFIPIIGKKNDKKSILSARDIIYHPDNVEGDFINVILGSQATRVGLNFYSTINITKYGPWWNPGSSYQAISRAIRATSHETMRRKMEEEIAKGNLPQDAKITVSIYQLCAIPISAQKAIEYYKIITGDEETLEQGDNREYQETLKEIFTEEDILLYIGFLATGKVHPKFIPEPDENLDVNPEKIPDKIKEMITEEINPKLYERLFKEREPAPRSKKEKSSKKSSKKKAESKEEVEEEENEEDVNATGYDKEELDLGDDERDEEEMEALDEEVVKTLPLDVYPPSIESRMYNETERKDKPNAKALYYMKRDAVDCQLQLARNIHENDEDLSPSCDYNICKYTPYMPYNGPPDLSTYNILYSSKDVETIRAYMRDDVMGTTNINRKKYIDGHQLHIESIPERLAFFVLSQEYVVKRFGYTSRVIDYGGLIYSGPPLENFYDENLIFTYVDLKNMIVKKSTEELMKIREITGFEKLQTEISKLEAYDIVQLVENIIDDYEHDRTAAKLKIQTSQRIKFADQIILKVFQRYIFASLFDNEKDAEGNTFNEKQIRFRNRPTALINKIAETIGKTSRRTESLPSSTGSSRKKGTPDRTMKKKAKEVEIIDEYMDPDAKIENIRLYVHLLNHLVPDISNCKYTEMKDYIEAKVQLRVYDSGEWKNGVWRRGIWRDATSAERIVYSLVIKDLIADSFPRSSIYGIISASKTNVEFKIRGEGEKEKTTVTLQNCGNRVKGVLYAYLAKLGYKVRYKDISNKMLKKLWADAKFNEKIPPFLEDDEDLYKKKMAAIYREGLERDGRGKTSYEKGELCNMIRDLLEKKGLLIYLIDWKAGEQIWKTLRRQ